MVTKRGRRWLRNGAAALVTILVVAVLGATWYYSSLLEDELLTAAPYEPEYALTVSEVGPGFVAVDRTPDTERAGMFRLIGPDGSVVLGDVISTTDATVTRRVLQGTLPVGSGAEIDASLFDGDPSDRELEFETVAYEGPLGTYLAWEIPGDDDTWVIHVHGKGADRREALRVLPAIAATGHPQLVITYRNDVGAPPAPNGRYGVGSTEWLDLEAAVVHALDRGATGVILYGYSMGGSITTMFLRESDLAGSVEGMILDSPLLDVGAAVDVGAAELNVPGFITTLAKGLSTLRFGIQWGELNHVAHAHEIAVPVLLIHGDEDETVPIESSDAFIEALTVSSTYSRVEGAGHVQAWNVDPVRYEEAVVGFIAEVTVPDEEPATSTP